ncbi:MFS transporter [Streptomyces sp. NPDC048639]|uniref:MFS transporter n=1 Tax=Streptomyces sp. NPDC048639 TaxID=3365581 RepID=UPI00372161B6
MPCARGMRHADAACRTRLDAFTALGVYSGADNGDALPGPGRGGRGTPRHGARSCSGEPGGPGRVRRAARQHDRAPSAFRMGITICALASVGCALAPAGEESAALLVLFRCLEGVGAALTVPVTVSIVADTFGEGSRGRAIALFAGRSQLASPAGPLVGGAIPRLWAGGAFSGSPSLWPSVCSSWSLRAPGVASARGRLRPTR